MSRQKIIEPMHWPRPRRMNGHWCYWFFEETYRENVYVIWPVTDEQRRAFVRKQFGFADVPASSGWNAKASYLTDENDEPCGQVLALKEWHGDAADAGLLAHECLHLTHNMLSKHDVLFDNAHESCNEHYTYMLARIMRTCWEALAMVKRK